MRHPVAGNGKTANLFLQCDQHSICTESELSRLITFNIRTLFENLGGKIRTCVSMLRPLKTVRKRFQTS